jgi:hypothetical protein
MIETSEDMEKTLVTLSHKEIAAHNRQFEGVTAQAHR